MAKEGDKTRDISGNFSIILSAISLIADIIALAQLSYSIVTEGAVTDFIVQMVTIILVFLFGVGLGYLGLKGKKGDLVTRVLSLYVWAYLITACLTYAGIFIQLRKPFTFISYISFLVILGVQLGAFTFLRIVSKAKNTVPYALTLMTMSVIHALVFLFYFVFVELPEIQYVIGEWIIWGAWNTFAVPMVVTNFGRVFMKRRSFLRETDD